MDVLLIFAWFLLAIGFPLSLIVSSYYVYVRGTPPYDIFGKLLLSLIIYGALTIPTAFLAGIIVFIGAHSNPFGSVLGIKGFMIGGAIIAVYAAAGWLANSLIVGHLIWPKPELRDFSN